ncbi:MAG: glycerol-3-phosphate acyltransferase [Oscillospiraceae bacterium]|nr:glycerol-3-phosphate acyltransferase [Oscillospiraceae bacterium]
MDLYRRLCKRRSGGFYCPLYIGNEYGIGFDVAYIASIFVIVGHIYPIYFKFKGGKGISTALGAMFVLNWIAFMTIAVGIIPMVFIIKIVSAVCAFMNIFWPMILPFFSITKSSSLMNAGSLRS